MDGQPTQPGSQKPWRLAALIFVLAAAVRLFYLYQTCDSPLFQTFQTDAQWHAEWAQAIAAGRLTDHRPFFRAPLYPFFLAAAYKLTGDSFTGARVVQHLLGAVSCVLVFLLGRRAFNIALAGASRSDERARAGASRSDEMALAGASRSDEMALACASRSDERALAGASRSDETVGLVAGLICALYGPLVHFENELLLPPLEVFLFLLALLALCAAVGAGLRGPALLGAAGRATWVRWLVAGVAFGLCAITRPNFLVVVAAVAVWWFWQGRKMRPAAERIAHVLEPNPSPTPGRGGVPYAERIMHVLALGLGVLVPILPVTLHNVLLGHDRVLISTQAGINFFIGNHALSDGKTAVAYVPPTWVEPPEYVDNVRWSSRVHAEHTLSRSLRDSEVSSFWLGRGLQFWRESPWSAFVLTLKKVYFFLNGFEIESNRSLYLDAFWSPLAGLLTWSWDYGPAFPLGVILPLALIGLCRPLRERPVARGLRLAFLVYAASVIAFFVTGRFRVPVVPLLAIFAARALVEIAEWLRKRQYRPLRTVSLTLCGLLLFCNSSFFGVRDVQYDRQASIIGVAYARLGQPARALAYFREAVAANPDNFAARLELAQTLFQLGRYGEAETEYRRVLESVPQRAGVHVGLAAALAEQHKPDEALASVRTALALDPQCGAAHALYAELLRRTGAYAEAWSQLREAERLGFRSLAELRAKLSAQMPEPAP